MKKFVNLAHNRNFEDIYYEISRFGYYAGRSYLKEDVTVRVVKKYYSAGWGNHNNQLIIFDLSQTKKDFIWFNSGKHLKVCAGDKITITGVDMGDTKNRDEEMTRLTHVRVLRQ